MLEQVRLEKSRQPFQIIVAAGFGLDDVALYGVDHDLEVFFQLDELLDEAGGVLKVDVVVDETVDD